MPLAQALPVFAACISLLPLPPDCLFHTLPILSLPLVVQATEDSLEPHSVMAAYTLLHLKPVSPSIEGLARLDEVTGRGIQTTLWTRTTVRLGKSDQKELG